MTDLFKLKGKDIDWTHVILAGSVFLFSFIVHALTVQRTVPWWDCGEFIASAVVLGIPHPPGTPLFIIVGHLFSVVPFVADVAYRVNFSSVIFSAFTTLFSYLLAVKIIRTFFNSDENSMISRWITFLGGVAGACFVAFGQTNWGNSVEAEVYTMAMAITVLMVLLTVHYFENRGSTLAVRLMVIVFYLANLGIGAALTVFLVVPVCAITFVLTKDATRRDYLVLSGCIVLELLFIMLFSDGRGGTAMFFLATALVGLVLLIMLFKKIDWTVAFALIPVFTVMLSFELFLVAVPVAFSLMLLLGLMHTNWNLGIKLSLFLALTAATTFTLWLQYSLMVYIIFLSVAGLLALAGFTMFPNAKNWRMNWKSALAILVISLTGFSVNLFLPIRSAQRPWIDENHPSRSYNQFIKFLDRKQYGSESMFDRMFHRRGTWENQFFRHPHMGFWSYFEGQYSKEGGTFLIWFALGIIGMYTAIKKRVEVGIPFMTVFLLCSAGLILYMNFADGIKYDYRTGDAYLEVRDRDYFFTPAFIFFGIAMGAGIAAFLQWLRAYIIVAKPQYEKSVVYVGLAFMLLPGITLATNYHVNDRSKNTFARDYAMNILNSCDKDAIIFTSGDNDTFPLWGVQEAYNFRKDVRVIVLSLSNTDWYIEQMKNVYGMPISWTDEQIIWKPVEMRGMKFERPDKTLLDRPRNRETYLLPLPFNGKNVRVQDMLVDEVVIENQWKVPIFFSGAPYAESPLKLREHSTTVGYVYRIDKDQKPGGVDISRTYDLFMNTFQFGGPQAEHVYRDETTTNMYAGVGLSIIRMFDEMMKIGKRDSAVAIMEHLIKVFPEHLQTYLLLVEQFEKENDSTKALALLQQAHEILIKFTQMNPDNMTYIQDLGSAKTEIGQRTKDQGLIDEGIKLLKKGFEANPNDVYAFRKYLMALAQNGRYGDMQVAAQKCAEYKININDAYVQRVLGITPPQGSVEPDN